MSTHSEPTRVVSVIPRDVASRFLVLEQPAHDGTYVPSFLGGRVEAGESLRAAFLRESREEVGVRLDRDLSLPAYQVTYERESYTLVTSVFEADCSDLGPHPIANPDDKVRRPSWLTPDEALARFETSSARHIAEPFMSFASGHVAGAEWRFDVTSARIPMNAMTPAGPDTIISGHFAVRGFHTDVLGVPAKHLDRPASLRTVAAELAALIAPYEPTRVIVPAVGGIALAYETAAQMDLPMTIVEKEPDGSFGRSRGNEVVDGRVALIDSTYHSGATFGAIQRWISSRPAEIVVAGVAIRSIATRCERSQPFSIPVHAIRNVVVNSWTPNECPMCVAGIALDPPPARFWR